MVTPSSTARAINRCQALSSPSLVSGSPSSRTPAHRPPRAGRRRTDSLLGAGLNDFERRHVACLSEHLHCAGRHASSAPAMNDFELQQKASHNVSGWRSQLENVRSMKGLGHRRTKSMSTLMSCTPLHHKLNKCPSSHLIVRRYYSLDTFLLRIGQNRALTSRRTRMGWDTQRQPSPTCLRRAYI